jgi:hypothetical protein
MINKKNCPQITSQIAKVSSGASESIDLFSLKSMKNFLQGNIQVTQMQGMMVGR